MIDEATLTAFLFTDPPKVHNALGSAHPLVDFVNGVRSVTRNPNWLPKDEYARRRFKVILQHQAGRTGGGPACPKCGERRLQKIAGADRAMGIIRLHQCFKCKALSRVYVEHGLQVKLIREER